MPELAREAGKLRLAHFGETSGRPGSHFIPVERLYFRALRTASANYRRTVTA